jgi:integrase
MKRRSKGDGCAYQPKFKTKEGKERLGSWRIKYTHNHKTYDEKVEVENGTAAREILKQRFAEIRSGEFVKGSEAETLRYDDIRGYLFREYEMNHCKSLCTARDGETKYIGHLKHLDEFFRGRHALDIDARLIDEFILERQRAGATNGTVNRTLNLLRRMFHLAVDQKKLRSDQVPKFKMLKEARPRSGFLEPEDFPHLRQELPEYLRTVLTLAYYTGMRSGEILTLKWTNIDLLGGEIRLEDTKNGEQRTIPLIGETGELLKIERVRHPGCEWVFSRDGRTPIQSLRKTWKSACVRAGLGHFTCRACGGELNAKFRCASCQKRCASPRYVGLIFHDLRRSGVRNLDRAGVPQHVAMKISGHKTDSVYRRYNIVSDRDLKEAGRRVNAYVSDRISQTPVKVETETSVENAEQKTVIQ